MLLKIAAFLPFLWLSTQSFSAETEREWLSNDEMGRLIYGRQIALPQSALPTMIEALDRFGNSKRSSTTELKSLLQTNASHLTIMDAAPLLSIEKKELAPVYHLLATNADPVVRFFGLVQEVMVLKEKRAAEDLYKLAHPAAPSPEQVLIDNCLHGVGIDLQQDTADSIFEFLSKMRDETRPAIGSAAKDVAIVALDGRKLKLSDFRGKPVLLHFWSTTCGPCIAEFPELEKELRSLKAAHPDFVVIGLSLDDSLKDLDRFLKKYDLPWIAACDRRGWGGEAAKAFHVTGIPNDVAIDRDGRVYDYSRSGLKKLAAKVKDP